VHAQPLIPAHKKMSCVTGCYFKINKAVVGCEPQRNDK